MPKRRSESDINDDNKKRSKGTGSTNQQDENGNDNAEESEDINMSQLSQVCDVAIPTKMEEPEVGIIESVFLKNFMCHQRLDFRNFGPKINFITGCNGSGKSAVLTAIMVALGGKATVTSRGSTVKNFITTGKNSAEVTVRLRNLGSDAFKRNLYGDSIIVQRRLSESGNSYKIKSAKGQTISTKREELMAILDQFNIQVDNPVAILTQETSRNFLHSKNAKDRYKFFLKATQLESVRTDYAHATRCQKDAEHILVDKKKTLPALEKEVAAWQRKYNALKDLDNLKSKIMLLKNELAWAFIHEQEKSLEPVRKNFTMEEARSPKFDQRIQESQEKIVAIEKEKDAIRDQLLQAGDLANALKPQLLQTKEQLDKMKKVFRNSQIEHRKYLKELQSFQKDKDQIEERMEEIRNSEQTNNEAQRLEREARINKLQEMLEALQAQQRTTSQAIEQFRGAVQQYQQELYNLKSQDTDIKSKLDGIQSRLRQCESARNDRYKCFGRWIPDVLAEIDKAHKKGLFHQKPRGPLGAEIKLHDYNWSLAIESCLKSLIHCFCVHDYHDEKELQKILGKLCPTGKKPSTIVSPFRNHMYDVSRNRPNSKYPTVLDLLDIQDPVIANCLIDQRSIESILLISGNDECRTFMSNKTTPKNVREAFTQQGDQAYCKPGYAYYSNRTNNVQYLNASVEDIIRSYQAEVTKVRQEQAVIRTAITKKQQEIGRNQQEQRKHSTQLTRVTDNIYRTEMEINELKEVEEPAHVDIATLAEDVAVLETQINQAARKETETRKSSETANVGKIEAEKAHHAIDEKIKDITDNSEPIQEKMALCETKIDQARSHKDHYLKKKKDHDDLLKRIKKEHDDLHAKLMDDTAKVEQICERIKTRRTAQNLENEIHQLERNFKAEEKNRGNKDEITRKFNDTKEAFDKIKREVKQLEHFLKCLKEKLVRRNEICRTFHMLMQTRVQYAFQCLFSKSSTMVGKMIISLQKERIDINLLKKAMVERQNRYAEFRRMMSLRAQYFFITMLSNSQHSGKMVFAHKLEQLEIIIHPNMAGQSTENIGQRDLRQLSGGERSFSTVCFILSLWDTMESPFRCLDEFDVFMDLVNRRYSMDMMLDIARFQKRQFLFLTPNDMSSLKTGPDMKIFQMEKPDRGQTPLPFSRNADSDEDN